ncbi:cuticle protein CP14.6-like [Diorhabda sublineata]|uniref:cuticle protein CP14.6-like n=1 Tax=Diorhabda sublineata TaxID=1163346 RepID=UPI0024E17D1C|nr:cuticle protein CP14.6-like [Diorhabda sublineata]
MILKALTVVFLVLELVNARPSNVKDSIQHVSRQSRQSDYRDTNNVNYYGNQKYEDARNARITRYDYDNNGYGSYNYNVTQSDGIYNEQSGTIENQGTDEESSRVVGYYAYPGSDGIMYYVEYIADKDGFRVAGDHIPRSANVGRVGQLGIPSAAIASLAGGGLG